MSSEARVENFEDLLSDFEPIEEDVETWQPQTDGNDYIKTLVNSSSLHVLQDVRVRNASTMEKNWVCLTSSLQNNIWA